MARQLFYAEVIVFMCFHGCFSFPQPVIKHLFQDFVRDGRTGNFTLIFNNFYVNKLFKANLCPEYGEPYSDSFFRQREVLPCFGAYDALFELCKFPEDKIRLQLVRLELKEPEKFCAEAKKLYSNLNISHNNENVKKWSDALNQNMQNEAHCKNMCTVDETVNEQCIAMLTFISEFKRLVNLNSKSKEVESNVKQINDEITNSRIDQDLETKQLQQLSPTFPHVNASHNKTSTDELTEQKTAIKTSIVNAEKQTTEGKVTISINENHSVPIPKKFDSTGEKHNESLPSIPVTIKTSPDKSHIQKINKEENTEATLDFDKTPISQDNAMPGNELLENEGIPPDTAEKVNEVHGSSFHISSPFPKVLKFPTMVNSPRTLSHEYDEMKLNDVKKPPTLADDRQFIWSPGMSKLNQIRDSYAESEDSYSFSYVVTAAAALCIVYFLFHYRNKLLALALEGRKGRNSRSRGRPSSANYSKLHSNLEEAIASNVTAPSATHVLY